MAELVVLLLYMYSCHSRAIASIPVESIADPMETLLILTAVYIREEGLGTYEATSD